MNAEWVILALLIVLPVLTGLAAAAAGEARARAVALIGSLASVVVGLMGLAQFDWSRAGEFQLAGSAAWIDAFGLQLSVGVDGVAMLLILLSVLLGPVCVLASWSAIGENRRMYYAWLSVLQGAMIGVFASRDLVLFYVCFEFTLLPMFILIRQYGSSPTNRLKAATKFFLYTFTGSLISLAGFVYVAWFASEQLGSWTLDMGVLAEQARTMTTEQQGWVLAALLAGFAVKVPLFPVHTWLPLAHTEAPTAGSVVLAAVLLKLGTYGIFRFCMGYTPVAFVEAAPLLAVLSIIGIVYAGLICWVQTDIKKLVAYSSVSHLGFCVLGLLAVNQIGATGSVLYMLSHGFSTGALFMLIGMMYERYHTRDMRVVGGLASKMPVWSTFMVFFAMASVGLPGLNGFPSELMCLLGTFQSDPDWVRIGEPGAQGGTLGPWYAAVAGTGMVVAAMYLLYMVGKICFGSLRVPPTHGHDGHEMTLPNDLNMREIVALLPMALGCLVFGLYPQMLIDAVAAPVSEMVDVVLTAARDNGGLGR